MKCNVCGENLTEDDKECPYCKTPIFRGDLGVKVSCNTMVVNGVLCCKRCGAPVDEDMEECPYCKLIFK